MTDSETDVMDDSEDDLSYPISPSAESAQGLTRGIADARLPSYSDDSELGYEMEPNRHNEHLQQRPFAAHQQQPRQQLSVAAYQDNPRQASELPNDTDSDSMMESSDPDSDFSDMEDDLPMRGR